MRRSARLLIAAGVFLLAFFAFAILHNALYGAAELAAGMPFVVGVLEYAHVAAFLVAVIVSPLGLATCLVAALISWRAERSRC